MRVIAGTAKGHPLVAPRGPATRPTSDRVKEALFSALMPRVPGARVLDLFAGSGALGIEALSRGADHATFVESARRALDALHDNLATTATDERARVVTRDVAAALRQLATDDERFDIVLLDPPYALAARELADVLRAVVAVTAPGAVVRLEQASRQATAVSWPDELEVTRTRRYGDTAIIEATRRSAAAASADRGRPGTDDLPRPGDRGDTGRCG